VKSSNFEKEEFDGMQEKSSEELLAIFQSKFPEDVIEDEKMMEMLNMLGKRLEHLQPKFAHVRKEARK
jgi:hypothetical protein